MKVKNVIISALGLIGKAPLARKLSGNEELTPEESETVDTLLYCFNSAEDEVARRYIPLRHSENLKSSDGEYYYTSFMYSPVRIKRVYSEGTAVEFKVYSRYLSTVSGLVTVEYEYAPPKKRIDSESEYGDEVGEYLFALGTASEYCLINGEIEMSELWENKYRGQIDAAQSRLPSCKNLPPRRWI